jgi:hypothetical protein
MGLEGTRFTMAASPDLIAFGLSSVDLPEIENEYENDA